MNSTNFSVFLKELGVLIMSPQWVDHESLVIDFPAVGHNFGLKTIENSLVIGRSVKFIFGNENDSVLFGSNWNSTEVDLDRVFVWNNGVLTNVANKDHVLQFMGLDKFVTSF